MRWTGVPCSERHVAAVLAALACLGVFARPPGEQTDRQRSLREIEREIVRLRAESSALEGRERGILEEIQRLDVEFRLREAELARAQTRVAEITEAVEERSAQLAELERAQDERRRYLAFRLRETYKHGPGAFLRPLVAAGGAGGVLPGLRYAVYLNQKDARTLRGLREGAGRVALERQAVIRERVELLDARERAQESTILVSRARSERQRYLRSVQGDRRKNLRAIRELEVASRELGGLVERFGETPAAARPLDLSALRGTLAWPADGKVAETFGTRVHPEFKTSVPHPGLDIEAPEGSDIRSVLEGRVVYSSWLRGYGLTAIVDHGDGLVSVYAHASALLVEQGEQVAGGQVLGKVGGTGSLRGPGLYFEIRKDGKAVDPLPWLRKR